jgi:hypothetical protein
MQQELPSPDNGKSDGFKSPVDISPCRKPINFPAIVIVPASRVVLKLASGCHTPRTARSWYKASASRVAASAKKQHEQLNESI